MHYYELNCWIEHSGQFFTSFVLKPRLLQDLRGALWESGVPSWGTVIIRLICVNYQYFRLNFENAGCFRLFNKKTGAVGSPRFSA